MSIIFYLAIILFLFVCLLLCGTILLQESKGGGLGASFGGEVQDSLFGTSTADILRKFTAWLATIFIASCVILSVWTASLDRSRKGEGSTYSSELVEQTDSEI